MEIVMPKVGLTMTEGAITQWHKREGDLVRKGELLFTFETEKSTLEFESPAEGVLTRILVPVGQMVPCLTPVAVIGEELPIPSPDHPLTSQESIPTTPTTPTTPTPQNVDRRPVSPRARLRARELGVDLAQVTGSGPDGAIRERDIHSAIANRNVIPAQAGTPISKASPIAQRIAAELGVDLNIVTGTGPDGRITREDVERAANVKRQMSNTEAERDARPSAFVTLSPARRVTAQRMAANAQAAPHVTLTTEADATELVSARNQLNAELNDKVSYNALLTAICARALKEHPQLNASWVEGTMDDRQQTSVVHRPSSIVLHSHIHIGLAVDTPRGLFVPVVRDAGAKSLAQIHRELSDVIARTLEGKISPDELSGGTFTITNLGMFEIDAFTPIINLPEAAILGVGRIVGKPVARGEQVVVRQMMALSLSFDHRVVDGGPAARFLQRIKQLIERPFALMVI